MFVINDLISDGVKPDPWSDPVALTALIGTGAPDPADQQTGLMLLRILEQSGRVPTLSEIDRIIDSFGRYSRQQLELVETYAAPLAVRLINLKKALMPPQGVRILEARSEEHTSELQSLMRISYAVFCLKKKKKTTTQSN